MARQSRICTSGIKKESTHHEDYQTRVEPRASIFEHMETFYTRKRRHSSLGFVFPLRHGKV